MSEKNLYDIGENDIRIIGPKASPDGGTKGEARQAEGRKRHYWLWLALLLTAAALVGILLQIRVTRQRHLQHTTVYTESAISDTMQNIVHEVAEPLANIYTEVTTDTVNDIPLRTYTPTGGHIELYVGSLPDDDSNIILAAQAADYRADNGQISGAFVYRGELLSRGHPKYGFCAIIGNEITMGMSRETPLFERAVEQDGYFFRQFSLVHNGVQGESTPPKGKSVRRALCYREHQLFITETEGRESFHDFTQALLDMHIEEAIALVGSVSLPLYEDKSGERITAAMPHYKEATETYIVWKR